MWLLSRINSFFKSLKPVSCSARSRSCIPDAGKMIKSNICIYPRPIQPLGYLTKSVDEVWSKYPMLG